MKANHRRIMRLINTTPPPHDTINPDYFPIAVHMPSLATMEHIRHVTSYPTAATVAQSSVVKCPDVHVVLLPGNDGRYAAVAILAGSGWVEVVLLDALKAPMVVAVTFRHAASGATLSVSEYKALPHVERSAIRDDLPECHIISDIWARFAYAVFSAEGRALLPPKIHGKKRKRHNKTEPVVILAPGEKPPPRSESPYSFVRLYGPPVEPEPTDPRPPPTWEPKPDPVLESTRVVAPHTRHGHWRGVWCGPRTSPRLEHRWIEETQVRGKGKKQVIVLV